MGFLILLLLLNNGSFISGNWFDRFNNLGFTLLLTFVLHRFGLLATATALFVDNTMTSVPLTTNLAAWWSGPMIASLVMLIAIGWLAYSAARAGQPPFWTGAGRLNRFNNLGFTLLLTFVLHRAGLLATATALFVDNTMTSVPLTTNLAALVVGADDRVADHVDRHRMARVIGRDGQVSRCLDTCWKTELPVSRRLASCLAKVFY